MRIRKNEDKDLADALLEARYAKEAVAIAQDEWERKEAILIEMIRAKQQKSTTVTFGNKLIKATVAQREVVNIDEPGLRKALGAKLFDTYCTKKLDKTALRRGISDNQVDPVIVAQHSQVSMGKAYVLFSEPAEKEPDE
jgi:methionine synthase I (cobalamin-dependent)